MRNGNFVGVFEAAVFGIWRVFEGLDLDIEIFFFYIHFLNQKDIAKVIPVIKVKYDKVLFVMLVFLIV